VYRFETSKQDLAFSLLTTMEPKPIPSIITIGDDTFTANPSRLAIDGKEILRGSSALIICGTPISLGSEEVVIGADAVIFPSATDSGLVSASAAASASVSIPTVNSDMGKKTSGASSSGADGSMMKVFVIWVAAIGFTELWNGLL